MTIEKHDLHHEFPEHSDAIHELKMNNAHFSRLFDEYHEVEHEVHRIDTGVENTSDDYLGEQKKKPLTLKRPTASDDQRTQQSIIFSRPGSMRARTLIPPENTIITRQT